MNRPELPAPETITLRDGGTIVIRPIRPDDAAYLQSTFYRLSAESIYFRFLSPKKVLTDEEAKRFANVDYQTQMAFVAIDREDGKNIVVGVSRYALLDQEQPNMAEAAVIVGDEHQRRGIGSLLLSRLVAYARLVGIRYLRGVIMLENNRMVDLVKRGGLPYEKRYEEGAWMIVVDLEGETGQEIQ
jgi:RimJ/RimL family protein N-acetyltransferase